MQLFVIVQTSARVSKYHSAARHGGDIRRSAPYFLEKIAGETTQQESEDMSTSETDEVDCKFKWGKKGRGGKYAGQPVQFYESFTYDGIEYFLYDSVYLYTDNEPEPYIGKLLKAWEEMDTKIRRIKVLWFFRPIEIHNWLGGDQVQKNELFLASGEGVGLFGVNPLEVLVGKCNVICTSKDKRNPQPSEEDLATTEYIFYRVFDVSTLQISDKIADQIAGAEVKFLFNRRGGGNSISSLRIQANGEVETDQTMTCNDKLDFENIDAVVEGNAFSMSNNEKGPLLEASNVKLLSLKQYQSASGDLSIRGLPSTSDKLVDVDTLGSPSVLKQEIFGDGIHSVKMLGVDVNENAGEAGSLSVENQNSVGDGGLSGNEISKKMKLEDFQTKFYEESRSEGLTVSTLYKDDKNDAMMQKVKMNLTKDERKSCVHVSENKVDARNLKDTNMKRTISEDKKGSVMQKTKANSNKVEVRSSGSVSEDGADLRNFKDSILKETKSKTSAEKSLNMTEKIGDHEVEVTRRPEADRSKWFKELPWEEKIQKARNQGTFVLLGNLDPAYISSDVEDIIAHGFRESCRAKVIECPSFSSPHCGRAFVIFKTREAADRVVKKLTEGCLMLPNGRPLIATKRVPPQENLDKFMGHFAIDRLRVANREEWKRAVFASHCSQPNTVEYEMALEWKLQQEISNKCWMELYKEQGEELKSLKTQLKKK